MERMTTEKLRVRYSRNFLGIESIPLSLNTHKYFEEEC